MSERRRNIFGKYAPEPPTPRRPRVQIGEFSVTLDGGEVELYLPTEGVTGGDVLFLWKQARLEARRQRAHVARNREGGE